MKNNANMKKEENQNINEETLESAAKVDEAASEENKEPEKSELEILKEENAKLKDHALRALAEAENTRKRAQKDIEEASKYSISGFARDLINVLENLVRAEENIPAADLENKTVQSIKEGVTLTKNDLIKVFERNGIVRIEPKVGDEFNHETQQAVMQTHHNEVAAGKVVQLLQAGYTIKDRLLRPAMVAVSKGPETKEENKA